jgi:hypothetical protein
VPVDAEMLQRLYTLPPEEFVASRNALARELRAAKDRETAAEVVKLRRPSVVDWALNVVARDQAALVTDALAAGAALREAQAAAVEGRAGADVGEAMRRLRTTTRPVAAAADAVLVAAGRPPGSQVAGLTARLAEIAGNEAAGEQLRAARLGSAELDAADPFAGLRTPPARRPRAGPAEPASSSPPPPAKARTAGGKTPSKTPTPSLTPTGAERREARRALAAAKRERDAAHTALASARRALDRAEAAVARAQTELDEARSRWETARARADEADARVRVQPGSENVTK